DCLVLARGPARPSAAVDMVPQQLRWEKMGSYLNIQDLACLGQTLLAVHPSFHAPNALAHCSGVGEWGLSLLSTLESGSEIRWRSRFLTDQQSTGNSSEFASAIVEQSLFARNFEIGIS